MKFKVDLKILFFLVLFLLTHQLQLYILIMTFCFIHECAHIILGVILGFKLQRIELMPLGFFCELKADIKDYNKKILNSNMVELKKIFIAIIGPLVNMLIVIICIVTHCSFRNIDIIIYCNILIFVFNLVPIFPLDGGRVLKSILRIFFGNIKANKIMYIISNFIIIILTVITSILILYFKNIAILLILVYLWYLVAMENRKFRFIQKVYLLKKL